MSYYTKMNLIQWLTISLTKQYLMSFKCTHFKSLRDQRSCTDF